MMVMTNFDGKDGMDDDVIDDNIGDEQFLKKCPRLVQSTRTHTHKIQHPVPDDFN